MGNKKSFSQMLRDAGGSLEFMRILVDAVLAAGGGDDDIRFMMKNPDYLRDVAHHIVKGSGHRLIHISTTPPEFGPREWRQWYDFSENSDSKNLLQEAFRRLPRIITATIPEVHYLNLSVETKTVQALVAKLGQMGYRPATPEEFLATAHRMSGSGAVHCLSQPIRLGCSVSRRSHQSDLHTLYATQGADISSLSLCVAAVPKD